MGPQRGDRHGKRSGDDPPVRRTAITGQAGTGPGVKRGGTGPAKGKTNTAGYGPGEGDDPKGKGRKPR